MGAGVTDAQYLMVTQHIFGRRKKGNRYVVKDVVYMRLVDIQLKDYNRIHYRTQAANKIDSS